MKEIKWKDNSPLSMPGTYLPGTYLSDSAEVTIGDDGIILAIRSDSHIFVNSVAEVIENYINDEIERFCNFNHISKRAWKKRGIITKGPATIELQVYYLCYKTRFRAYKHEIKFGFNISKSEINN